MKSLPLVHSSGLALLFFFGFTGELHPADGETMKLPPPDLNGEVSLEKALAERRSIREYSTGTLTSGEISQLLWACQGVTSRNGFRTAPSAGALYPLEVYVVAGRVSGLEAGIYHYVPGPGIGEHSLELLRRGAFLNDLADAALGQGCIRGCAACFVIGTVVARTAAKYGQRAERYVLIEVGHAAQNLCLQATALGIGAVTVGAFYDSKVKQLLDVGAAPVYLIPVGRR